MSRRQLTKIYPPAMTQEALDVKLYRNRKRINAARYPNRLVTASGKCPPLRRGGGNPKMGHDVAQTGRWAGLAMLYVALV